MVEAKKKGARSQDKVYVWPYLVRVELICFILVMLVLTVWSITIDAPLEEAANPTKTPNPSKAPWYFLGLQDMLVYFDPWMAGVVLPTLIIVGLMVIPYVDVNPLGNGYYTFKERRFAILTFLFGFLVLWILLIILGVFFRGPGWNLFWPWEFWDPHKVVALTNVDLSEKFGIRDYVLASIFGGAVVGGYYAAGTAAYFFVCRKAIKSVGINKIGIKSFLFLTMMALVIKMALRMLFNIKYIWVTPWFNI